MPISGQQLRELIESIAPRRFAMEGDKTGLQVGSYERDVSRVLVTLDTTTAVVEEAIEKSCEWILSHHAVIFRPLDELRTDRGKGRLYEALLKNDISVYVPHTAMDIARGGLNDDLAALFGLEEPRPLKETGRDESCLLLPTHGAQHQLCAEREAASLLRAARKSGAPEPYQVALANYAEPRGIGRIGKLRESLRLEDFAKRVAQSLDCSFMRLVGDPEQPVKKVALLCGDGNRFVQDAAQQGADVLVTGDVYYHTALEARSLGLALIDPGHNATERRCGAIWQKRLSAAAEAAKIKGLEVIASETCTEPFRLFSS